MLQKKAAENIGVNVRDEHKFWRKVKELISERKRKVDEKFGRALSEVDVVLERSN